MRLPIYKKKVVILLKKVDRMVDSDVEDDGGKEGRENDPTLGWSSRSYQKEAGTIESKSKHLVQIQSASGITPRQNALSRTGNYLQMHALRTLQGRYPDLRGDSEAR